MATIFSQPLLPPQSEDVMDVSSPGQRVLDDDIDIDLDDDLAAQGDAQGDEDMVDDATNDGAATDDLMLDDEPIAITTQPPRTYTSIAYEDDLIDYSDEEDEALPTAAATAPTVPKDTPVYETEVPQASKTTPVPHTPEAQTDSADVANVENVGAATATGLENVDRATDAPDAHDAKDAGNAEHTGHHTPTEDAQPSAHEDVEEAQPILEFEEHQNLTAAEDEDEDHDQLDEHQPSYQNGVAGSTDNSRRGSSTHSKADVPVTSDTANKSRDSGQGMPETAVQALKIPSDSADLMSADGPGTPTDTGLHPILFHYDNVTYPLFKSKTSPNGLLKDDNLVSVSLADFIKACRQQIAIRTDHGIAESFEVQLAFDDLHLSVTEDSPASFETSLKDVLDVFLQLHENDGIHAHDIPALEITCNLQVKFSTSIAILQKAASIGDGMSNFIPAQISYDEADDIQHDDSASDVEADHDDHEHSNEHAEEHADDETDQAHEEADEAHDATQQVPVYKYDETDGESYAEVEPYDEHDHDQDGDGEYYEEDGEQTKQTQTEQQIDDAQDPESWNHEENSIDRKDFADESEEAAAHLTQHTNETRKVLRSLETTGDAEEGDDHSHSNGAATEDPDDFTDGHAPNGSAHQIEIPELEDDDDIDLGLDDEPSAAVIAHTATTTTATATPTKRARPAGDEDDLEPAKRPRPT